MYQCPKKHSGYISFSSPLLLICGLVLMSLSGWIHLGPCTFKFFESMFSVSTHSSVTSMISVVSGSSHSASQTDFCTLALLLLDIPPPIIHLARLSFCIGCMSMLSIKTLGCLWNNPIFLNVVNPSNIGPLAYTI